MATPKPPEDLDAHLAETRSRDVLLALMVGVIAAWWFTNRYGYRATERGWEVDVGPFLLALALSLSIATAVSYRLLRNWRREKFTRRR